MKNLVAALAVLALVACTPVEDSGNHLFILSGQSNMERHIPQEAFIPTVENALGRSKAHVVQHASSGKPIYRWYKDWTSPAGEKAIPSGDHYDELMKKVSRLTRGRSFDSVTFVWMQGERDARNEWSNVYAASLAGLYDQLSRDLGRNDINFVIGRLSDFDMENRYYRHWTKIRQIQEEFAASHPRFTWVNTDDLNDGLNRRGQMEINGLHLSADGYRVLGQRFAEASLELIEQHQSP